MGMTETGGTPVLRVDTRSTPTNDYTLFQYIVDAKAGGDDIKYGAYIEFR